MALVTLAEAARLTRKNPSTITRAAQKGKVSCQSDGNGQRGFDPAELERVFGKLHGGDIKLNASTRGDAPESTILHEEIKLLHERERALVQERMCMMQAQIEDLQKDRDHWRHQATYLIEDKSTKEVGQLAQESAAHLLTEAQAQLEKVRGSWLGRLLFKV